MKHDPTKPLGYLSMDRCAFMCASCVRSMAVDHFDGDASELTKLWAPVMNADEPRACYLCGERIGPEYAPEGFGADVDPYDLEIDDPEEVSPVMRPTELARLGEAHRDWYYHAHRSILDYCAHPSWPQGFRPSVGGVADVLAITSPRVSVARNVRLTREYFETGSLGPKGVLPGVLRSLETWHNTGDILGPKTSEFARALRGDGSALVLDTHMFQAYGHPAGRVPGVVERRRIERSVRSVAGRLGWQVAETQAAMWAGRLLSLGKTPARLDMGLPAC